MVGRQGSLQIRADDSPYDVDWRAQANVFLQLIIPCLLFFGERQPRESALIRMFDP